jgi:SAM-dependent methyltransferase
MTSQEKAFQDFADFAARLKGDEKSEAQTFLFHLLEAFGHDANTLPAGASFEYRVRFPGDKTKYSDLVWPGRVLIEMKSRGEKLSKHYQQTFDYWLNLVPHRPPYVVLCNFDELWIYDFNTQLQEPLEKLKISELRERHSALNFLYPKKSLPIFGNNWVEVSREAARNVADAFNSMVQRGEPRERARRYILQCVVSMFAEDIGLLPDNFFTELLDECRRSENLGQSTYDLVGQLFRQMNDKNPARGGRFAGVDYFNGGLFSKVEPIELSGYEFGLLFEAAKEKWQYVQPVIFGTLFEGSLGKEERHALGAHFTYEADIQKIVRPTIVRPWEERIAAARTATQLRELLAELRSFRVLDPACGSGNFLFVAFRALCELEEKILLRLFSEYGTQVAVVGTASRISPKQFYGLDINENAVETAKVTLMLARRLATRQAEQFWSEHADALPEHDARALKFERDLPLDNLDKNIRCEDALFNPWPECDAIIGNPPFLDARRVTMIHGMEYTKRIRAAFPDVPGRADFCVHWFRKAHEVLKPGCRAGFVGTNSIRQNYSREGGLDYIVQNGGTILEAVSSQPWSGEAAVHVSIVNWIKGEVKGPKTLQLLTGTDREGPWERKTIPFINSSLSFGTDVASAKHLEANRNPKKCLEGQQPGHTGFVIKTPDLKLLTKNDKDWRAVVFPILNGDDFISGTYNSDPSWLIDFGESDLFVAKRHELLFEHLEKVVLPTWTENAKEENKKIGKTHGEHQDRLQTWWLLKRRRGELIAGLAKLKRYIVCSAVTKRQIFEFISTDVRPSNALKAFLFEDDYSFGILSSGIHWAWFTAKCSTLTERFRYTPDTVFDTFPWPQFEVAQASAPAGSGGVPPPVKTSARKPGGTPAQPAAGTATLQKIRAVAAAAVALRALRRETMANNGWPLRELYKSLETPGANKLRDAQAALDTAVRAAYGMKPDEDILAFLLKLNLELADKESKREAITPPGLPAFVEQPKDFISQDCVTVVG